MADEALLSMQSLAQILDYVCTILLTLATLLSPPGVGRMPARTCVAPVIALRHHRYAALHHEGVMVET